MRIGAFRYRYLQENWIEFPFGVKPFANLLTTWSGQVWGTLILVSGGGERHNFQNGFIRKGGL